MNFAHPCASCQTDLRSRDELISRQKTEIDQLRKENRIDKSEKMKYKSDLQENEMKLQLLEKKHNLLEQKYNLLMQCEILFKR